MTKVIIKLDRQNQWQEYVWIFSDVAKFMQVLVPNKRIEIKSTDRQLLFNTIIIEAQ